MMRTHLIHRLCGGDIYAENRKVITEPGDAEWPKDVVVRVPVCEKCRTVVSVAECDDDRIPPG